jgi:hypothetical protein
MKEWIRVNLPEDAVGNKGAGPGSRVDAGKAHGETSRQLPYEELDGIVLWDGVGRFETSMYTMYNNQYWLCGPLPVLNSETIGVLNRTLHNWPLYQTSHP